MLFRSSANRQQKTNTITEMGSLSEKYSEQIMQTEPHLTKLRKLHEGAVKDRVTALCKEFCISNYDGRSCVESTIQNPESPDPEQPAWCLAFFPGQGRWRKGVARLAQR